MEQKGRKGRLKNGLSIKTPSNVIGYAGMAKFSTGVIRLCYNGFTGNLLGDKSFLSGW
jgi:hypothetical protein